MPQQASQIGQYTVTASSAALNASTDQIAYGTTLKALPANAGVTYVQIPTNGPNGTITTVTSANGFPIEAGAVFFIPASQAGKLSLISVIGTASDKLAYSVN